MIPPRLAPIAFGLILSGCMSLLVSGVSTYRALGMIEGFFGVWMGNWSVSWAVAFPTVLVIGPIARRAVARLTAGA